MTRRLGLPTLLLWPACALALIGLLGSLILVRPHDFWWHMKVGEVIAAQGAIPQVDQFSFTRAGTPFVYQSWLSELLFYRLYQAGGLALIVLARNVLLLLAYALVLWQAYRRSDSWRLAAVAGVVAGLVAFNNWSVRPQIFSWLPFTLCWLILSDYTGGRAGPRRLLLLPLIELAWANLHGAFTLGLALAGIITAGETITLLSFKFRRGGSRTALTSSLELRPESEFDPAAWRAHVGRVRALWLALAGMLLATLANPLGPGLYAYVVTLLTDPSSQQLVVEWQPPALSDPAGRMFYLTLVAQLLLWLRAPRAGRLSDMLVLLGFTWLALGGVRYVLWYGMIAAPLLAELLAARRPGAPARRVDSALQRRLNLVVVLLLFAPALLLQPPLRGTLTLPPLFAGVPGAGPEGALVTDDTPMLAVAYLREHPAGTRMYHDMVYGSYLVWAFGGQPPVFADPRVELYPLEQWMDYRRIAQGCDYNALLQKYQIDALLLDRTRQEPLIGRLARDPAWEQVYPAGQQTDARSVIFRARPGQALSRSAGEGCL